MKVISLLTNFATMAFFHVLEKRGEAVHQWANFGHWEEEVLFKE